MEILKSIKLRQLRKEREQIKANRETWINLHKHDSLDASLSRTFFLIILSDNLFKALVYIFESFLFKE